MNEPRYIDAVKIHEDLISTIINDATNPGKNTVFDFGWRNGVQYAAFVIENEPAADVVQVLRCKDCQYAKPHDDDFWIKNNAPLLCEKYDWYVENDGYCSEGELKNG